MVSKIKLLFDMDGCISDFQKAYAKYQADDAAMEGEIENIVTFERAIKEQLYIGLDWMPNGEKLAARILEYAKDDKYDVAFLSSTGTIRIPHMKDEVVSQKKKWLEDRNLLLPAHFVERKLDKADYASPATVLIDDKPGCIKPFEEQGGIGVRYVDSCFEESMVELDWVLQRMWKHRHRIQELKGTEDFSEWRNAVSKKSPTPGKKIRKMRETRSGVTEQEY